MAGIEQRKDTQRLTVHVMSCITILIIHKDYFYIAKKILILQLLHIMMSDKYTNDLIL